MGERGNDKLEEGEEGRHTVRGRGKNMATAGYQSASISLCQIETEREDGTVAVVIRW